MERFNFADKVFTIGGRPKAQKISKYLRQDADAVKVEEVLMKISI